MPHRRAMSLPQVAGAPPVGPYAYTHTYFIQPTSCASSPSPGPGAHRRRSCSPDGPGIPPPEPAFDLEYGDVTIPFATFAPHASTMSLP